MNNYQFFRQEQACGRMAEYVRRGFVPIQLEQWADIYQFHLDHPKASTWLVANLFGVGQTHVRRIYAFMEDGEKSEPFLGLGHVAKKQ